MKKTAFVAFMCLFAGVGWTAAQTSRIESSTVIADLQSRKTQNPKITASELAAQGNALLAQKGLNYRFDVCEFLEKNAKKLPKRNENDYLSQFSAPLMTAGGKKQTFQFDSGEDSPCGECFTEMAAFQVTGKEMILRADGKQVRLLRPKDFGLDEVALVKDDLKTVVRRWEVPTQTAPLGVSADGTKIYLPVFYEEDLGELALELSEDGKMRFRARKDLDLTEGETLKDFPKEEGNDYLSFLRFRQNGKTHVVKFSQPCT